MEQMQIVERRFKHKISLQIKLYYHVELLIFLKV